MKFLADEDIARVVISVFRKYGHDILDIKESGIRGISDTNLIKIAESEDRIIVTHDKDFLGLVDNPRFNFKLIFLKAIPSSKGNMIKIADFLLQEKIWLKMKRSTVIVLEKSKISATWD